MLKPQQSHFFQYRHVQDKQDLDYYSRIPDYIGEDHMKVHEEVNANYETIKKTHPEFFHSAGGPRHTWSDQGVVGMAEIPRKRKLYSKKETRNMSGI